MNRLLSMLKQAQKEDGQVLPLALVVLALGSIVVASLLTALTTSVSNIGVYEQSEFRDDIAEAATEYVTQLIETANYTLDELPDTLTLNGITAHFTVVEDTGATSNFSSALFNDTEGFTEWVEEHVSLIEEPRGSGNYIAEIRKQSYLQFTVDLDSYTDLVLKVHARVNFTRNDDYVVCRISKDSANWTPVYTWTIADNSLDYEYYNIDLDPYGLTQPFWISFEVNMQTGNADFNMDEIKIASGYTIVVTIE